MKIIISKFLIFVISITIFSSVFANSFVGSDNGKFEINGFVYFKDYYTSEFYNETCVGYNQGEFMDVGFGKVLSVNNDGDVLFYEYLDASKKTWDKSDIFIKMKKEKGWPTYDKDYIDFVRNAAFVRVKKYSFHVSGRNKHQDGKTTTLFVLPLKNVSHIEGKIDNNRNDTTIKFIISSKNSVGDTINKYVEIDNKKVKLIKVETIKVEKEMSQAEYEKTVNAINGVK